MPKEENDLRDRTKDFALRIMRMFSSLPKTTEAQTLGKQALRSGTAAGANYREAYRGRSKAEFISKCGDSLRELEETGYWLELLVDGKIVKPTKLSALRQECDELIAIFVTILKRSKRFLNSSIRLLPFFHHSHVWTNSQTAAERMAAKVESTSAARRDCRTLKSGL